MTKSRFYHAYNDNGDHLCGVIARSAKQAKHFVYGSEYAEGLEWIEITINWQKGADISGFEVGIFNENNDCFEGIKRGLFTIQGEGCECCDAYSDCSNFLENN